MKEKIPMTVNGRKQLEAELKNLIQVERPSVVNAIEVARAHGDLSENADYSAAKERQSIIEGRIQEINGKLINAKVIDPKSIKLDKIVFGATVTLVEEDSKDEVTYQIVGIDESDLKKNKISITSPIARALIGRKKEDEITVNAPKGQINYYIVSVEYK